MYAFTGLASCVILGYVFSVLTGGQNKNIDGLTIYDKKIMNQKGNIAPAIKLKVQ